MALTPARFDYIRPHSVDEAVEILLDNSGSAKLLGGGQSLIPLLKTRIVSFEKLVDIGNLSSLNHITRENGILSIGSTTRVSQLELSEEVLRNFPMLHEAAVQIADPLIRNMGTVGGNVSHADPGNDLPPVMVAYGAAFVFEGGEGEREIDAEKFFLGPFETAAKEDEVLTELRIPSLKAHEGAAFVKINKMSGDFSVASAAARISVSDDMRVTGARVVVASASPAPVRLQEIEESLIDSRVDESALEHMRKNAPEEIEIMQDATVPEKYRKFAVSSSVSRAVENAYRRATER